MATKKKRPAKKPARRAAAAKKRPARKGAAKRPFRPAAAPSAPPVIESTARRDRNGLLLLAIILVVVLAVFWRSRQESLPAPAPAVADAPAAAAPEGRSVAPAPAAAKPAPVPARPAARRGTAGETGAPALTFDRSDGGSLSIRCWRPEGGAATLDVFGPRNELVLNLRSEAGPAGWVSLNWDGRDKAGKRVRTGLYYLRPSAKDLQEVRDVWVKG